MRPVTAFASVTLRHAREARFSDFCARGYTPRLEKLRPPRDLEMHVADGETRREQHALLPVGEAASGRTYMVIFFVHRRWEEMETPGESILSHGVRISRPITRSTFDQRPGQ